MAFDPQDTVEQVRHELDQRLQAGYDVERLVDQIGLLDAGDDREAGRLFDELEQAPRRSDWPYVEPDSLEGIVATLPPSSASRPPSGEALYDKILGGWLGRISGCMVGKPVEDGGIWDRSRLRAYLELAGAYPLRDYIPALDPMPSGYALVADCWRSTTLGNVDGSARDDDIDYTMLALHLLETYGRGFTTADVSVALLGLFPYTRVYTAERVTYRNLLRDVAPKRAGGFRNPYREWIGALIRGDMFGYVNPGDPRSAALLAYQDASLSHRGNGIYGAQWSAALVAAAFTAGSIADAVRESLRHVPPRSRLYEAVSAVVALFEAGATWEETMDAVDARWAGYSWVHAVNNAAAITAGLLFADEEPSAAIGLTVMAGMDTDSNGATAGSVIGAYVGASALPAHLTDPLRDTVRSAVYGFDGCRITDLARRTTALAAALPRGAA